MPEPASEEQGVESGFAEVVLEARLLSVQDVDAELKRLEVDVALEL